MDRSDYVILVVWWYTNRQVNNLSQRRCKMYSCYILSNLVNNHSVSWRKKWFSNPHWKAPFLSTTTLSWSNFFGTKFNFKKRQLL